MIENSYDSAGTNDNSETITKTNDLILKMLAIA